MIELLKRPAISEIIDAGDMQKLWKAGSPARSTTTERWTRRQIATLFVAGVGVGISLLALVLSLLSYHEEIAVNVEGAAVANTLGSTSKGYGVRVSIINDSLRPVIVKSATLVMDGVEVAPAREYLPDPRWLNDQSTRGDEPLRDAVPFPLAISARGARTVGPLLDFTRADEIFYARRHGPILKGVKAFCHQLADPRSHHRIEVRVVTEPGGVTAFPVRMIGPIDGGTQWYLEIAGPGKSPDGVIVHRKVSAPSTVHFVRIAIWRRGHLVRRLSEPLFGAEWARFPYSPLTAGKYRITLSDAHSIVAGGEFSVPRPGNSAWAISPSSATTENAQCALFRHPELRAVVPQPLPAHPLFPPPG